MKDNNTLIANFIGMQKTNIGWYDAEEILIEVEKDNTFDILKSNTDWNWLMQVVEKIESLGYNIDTMKVDITKYQSSQFCGIYIDGKRIYTNYCETKIEAVYNACVEFVEWWNKENN